MAGYSYRSSRRRGLDVGRRRKQVFISVMLSSINGDGGGGQGIYSDALSVSSVLGNVVEKNVESENEVENDVLVLKEVAREEKHRGGGGTFNTAKHLWAALLLPWYQASRSRMLKLVGICIICFVSKLYCQQMMLECGSDRDRG
ncbi:hypothetical protein C2S51_007395 [Perilla frutescens var. frutescens]|nr:hypothetical protein C2S51_007395 [Perilla frutescens var. frutescens]